MFERKSLPIVFGVTAFVLLAAVLIFLTNRDYADKSSSITSSATVQTSPALPTEVPIPTTLVTRPTPTLLPLTATPKPPAATPTSSGSKLLDQIPGLKVVKETYSKEGLRIPYYTLRQEKDQTYIYIVVNNTTSESLTISLTSVLLDNKGNEVEKLVPIAGLRAVGPKNSAPFALVTGKGEIFKKVQWDIKLKPFKSDSQAKNLYPEFNFKTDDFRIKEGSDTEPTLLAGTVTNRGAGNPTDLKAIAVVYGPDKAPILVEQRVKVKDNELAPNANSSFQVELPGLPKEVDVSLLTYGVFFEGTTK